MAFFEICKARGDLLFPIRTVEKVRKTSDAPRFRERPAFIPGQLQCFLSSRIEVAMPMPNMMESRDGLFHWR